MESQKQMLQNKKGQVGQALIAGFVVIGAVLMLLILLVYIFGLVGTDLETTAESNVVRNQSGYVNQTGFQLASGIPGAPRTFTNVIIINQTGFVIPAANYSITTGGLVRNATAIQYLNTNVSYTFINDSAEIDATQDAQVNSTRAIPIVGILFIILAVGAVIGVLITSLIGRGKA